MKSIDIADAKQTLKTYLKKLDFPAEVKRMLIHEIYEEVQQEAELEIYGQAAEREGKNDE